jgi:hypothetical protein
VIVYVSWDESYVVRVVGDEKVAEQILKDDYGNNERYKIETWEVE